MNISFIIILILLIIFTYRVINSYSLKQFKSVIYHLERAKAEYIEPPRPHSKSYIDFLQLASSIHSSQQKRLTLVLSQLIKDNIEIRRQTGNLMCSENLNLLINDPNGWYRQQSALIVRSGSSRKKDLPDILYKQYIQILNEVEELLGISLISKMEL